MVDIDKSVWSRWEVVLIVFIIVVSLIIVGGYGSYTVISSRQNPAGYGLTVKNGDIVDVDYIGMFEDGTVFDTSIRGVAENNTMYPKSLSYTVKYEFNPMGFTVGAGQMIKGFDAGIVGMALNQTKTIIVAPEQGYGYPDASLIDTRGLTQSVPVFEWFGNTSNFIDLYQVVPEVGITIKNQRYGWNMTVFHVDYLSDNILIRNSPFIGETIQSPEGWNSRVVSIDSSANKGVGEIVIRHLISQDDVGKRMFTDESGRKFVVSMIDAGAGTYTADFNREVVGKTLIFKVTVVSITRAP